MQQEKIHSLSVIVPVFNGSGTISILTKRLMDTLSNSVNTYEIILVNDGSQDDSWEIIQKIGIEYKEVTGVNLMRNFGQHNAILCGIRLAKHDLIITMDDDLQHPPEEIPSLIKKLNEGYDVVYGTPKIMPHSPWRNFSSWLIKRVLAFVMGITLVKEISAFRAFRSKLKEGFIHYNSPGVIIDVLLAWGTTRFASVAVNEDPREIGKSNYTFSKLFKQVFLILTGFSTIPLRFASILGLSFTIVGFGILVYVFIIYFALGSIPGFPFLASIISVFSGTQLLVLGIFGEYLARVFDKSMDRPPYIVDKTTNSTDRLP